MLPMTNQTLLDGSRRTRASLLAAMFFCTVAISSYFPYVSTALSAYLGRPHTDLTTVIAISSVVGNLLALMASASTPRGGRLVRLRWAYVLGAAGVGLLPAGGMMPGLALAIAMASITLYRLALGLAGNLSRALQLECLSDSSGKAALFARIKFTTSLAGALGPLVGAYAMSLGGFQMVIAVAVVSFGMAASLVLTVRRDVPASAMEPSPSASVWRKLLDQPAAVWHVSLAAMVHYIFEAQIYAAMAIHLQQNSPHYVTLISLMFSLNSVLLIVLVFPVSQVLRRRDYATPLLAAGTLMSCAAVAFSACSNSTVAVIAIALLFTVGELIAPQLLVDMVTDHAKKGDALGAIALFNFLTTGLGISLGYALGGPIATRMTPLGGALAWIGVYALFMGLVLRIPARRGASAPN